MSVDDDNPRVPVVHELGQDLSLLSIGELKERIVLLREEIQRIEQEIVAKSTSRQAAESVFR